MKRPVDVQKLLAARPAATIWSPSVSVAALIGLPRNDRAETKTLGGVLNGGHKAVKIFLRPQKVCNLDDSGKIRAVVLGQVFDVTEAVKIALLLVARKVDGSCGVEPENGCERGAGHALNSA
jgi:hypothetical protein